MVQAPSEDDQSWHGAVRDENHENGPVSGAIPDREQDQKTPAPCHGLFRGSGPDQQAHQQPEIVPSDMDQVALVDILFPSERQLLTSDQALGAPVPDQRSNEICTQSGAEATPRIAEIKTNRFAARRQQAGSAAHKRVYRCSWSTKPSIGSRTARSPAMSMIRKRRHWCGLAEPDPQFDAMISPTIAECSRARSDIHWIAIDGPSPQNSS